jgi:hypothetical protein
MSDSKLGLSARMRDSVLLLNFFLEELVRASDGMHSKACGNVGE